MAQPKEYKDLNDEVIHKLFADKVPQILRKYRLSTFLGKGLSSKVVKGELITSQNHKKKVAIKLLGSTTSHTAIMDEIHILRRLNGLKNVVEYIEHFQNGRYTALVTNYLRSPSLKEVYVNFTPAAVQCYMKNLLIGLEQVHSKGYFHGDIKPANFLFSRDLDEFLLIDFGMTQKLGTQLRSRGTRGFKAPEILLKYPIGTSVVDIWGAGAIFAGLLSGVLPFFIERGENAFKEFCIIFGSESVLDAGRELHKIDYIKDVIKDMEVDMQMPLDLKKVCFYFRKYNLILRKNEIGRKCSNCKQSLAFCLCCYSTKTDESISEKIDEFPSSTYDLLERMLNLNPSKRITAKEALMHPFFKDKLDATKNYFDASFQRFKKGVIAALSLQSDDSDSTKNESASFTLAKFHYWDSNSLKQNRHNKK